MAVQQIHSSQDISTETWNALAPHPLQSWEWGEARRAMGAPVLRFVQYNEQQPTAVFQLTLHNIPHTKQWVGYAPRTIMPPKELLEALKQQQDHSIAFVQFEPIAPKDAHIAPELIRSPRTLMSATQMFVNLTPTPEALLKNLKSNLRHSVRYSQKKGVITQETSTKEGLEAFIALHEATQQRQGFGGRSAKELRLIWEHTQPISRIWLATHQEAVLAAAWLFHYNNTAYYVYAASSADPAHRKLRAPGRLVWDAMIAAKEQGATMLDLWGVLPKEFDKSHPWAGFTQFKEGFGGYRETYIGTLEYVIRPCWHRLYTLAYRARTLRKGRA